MNDFEFKAEVLQRLTSIETTLKSQDYKGVSEKAEKALEKAIKNEEDIREMQEKNKWYYRTIVAAFLVALVGIIVSFLKTGMGIN